MSACESTMMAKGNMMSRLASMVTHCDGEWRSQGKQHVIPVKTWKVSATFRHQRPSINCFFGQNIKGWVGFGSSLV
jgi:hypothetical protein